MSPQIDDLVVAGAGCLGACRTQHEINIPTNQHKEIELDAAQHFSSVNLTNAYFSSYSWSPDGSAIINCDSGSRCEISITTPLDVLGIDSNSNSSCIVRTMQQLNTLNIDARANSTIHVKFNDATTININAREHCQVIAECRHASVLNLNAELGSKIVLTSNHDDAARPSRVNIVSDGASTVSVVVSPDSVGTMNAHNNSTCRVETSKLQYPLDASNFKHLKDFSSVCFIDGLAYREHSSKAKRACNDTHDINIVSGIGMMINNGAQVEIVGDANRFVHNIPTSFLGTDTSRRKRAVPKKSRRSFRTEIIGPDGTVEILENRGIAVQVNTGSTVVNSFF